MATSPYDFLMIYRVKVYRENLLGRSQMTHSFKVAARNSEDAKAKAGIYVKVHDPQLNVLRITAKWLPGATNEKILV